MNANNFSKQKHQWIFQIQLKDEEVKNIAHLTNCARDSNIH